MPDLFCGIFIAMLAATFIYAKGTKAASRVVEGLRFGLADRRARSRLRLSSWATRSRTSAADLAMMSIASLVEWMIVGIVIGLVYKAACRRRAGRSEYDEGP